MEIVAFLLNFSFILMFNLDINDSNICDAFTLISITFTSEMLKVVLKIESILIEFN